MTRAAVEQSARKRTAAAMLGATFPQQYRAIVDPARLKSFFCTRRAGKSFGIGLYLLLAAVAHPQSSCLYLGLTKASATGIMNKDVLRVINERFDLGAKWRESHSRWELPNGSYIYLRGADANRYEISKVVGQKYRVAALDEASKYRYDVNWMVHSALVPAMGDDLGTVILSGTPSNITSGLYFDVTRGSTPGWSNHSWTWRDNVFARDNVQKAHDELVAANPGIVDTPIYQQEWGGKWVIDQSVLVYRYREDLNTAAALPKPAKEYTYLLGLDLGFTDPTAIVVGAYHPNDPTLYIVHAEKHEALTFHDVGKIVQGLWWRPSLGFRGPYDFAAMVGDASALQGVEELRQRHHLPIEAAEKPGKRGVIEAMNSELQTGRVKVLPGAEVIFKEWGGLVWDERKLEGIPRKWEERPTCPNHLADAALYMWRRARNYDATPVKPKEPAPLTPEWEALRHEREAARLAKLPRRGEVNFDEPPPWEDQGDAFG